MPIRREQRAAPTLVVDGRTYTLVAGDTVAEFQLAGARFRVGYARPLRLEAFGPDGVRTLRIPDRQLQVLATALILRLVARMIARRRAE